MTDKELIEMNNKFISHSVVIEIVGQLMYLCESLNGLNIAGVAQITFKEENGDEVDKLTQELGCYALTCSDDKIDWEIWESMYDDDTRSDYGGSAEHCNRVFNKDNKVLEQAIKSIEFSIS